MSRGLGQFERWILLATYAKTVRHQLPAGWRMPAGYMAGQGRGSLDVWSGNLSRAEILLNRFGLETSDRRHPRQLIHQCFRNNAAYKSALSNLSRVLSTLSLADYIRWDPCCFASLAGQVQWDGISLTEKGLDAAERLSVDSSWPISGRD